MVKMLSRRCQNHDYEMVGNIIYHLLTLFCLQCTQELLLPFKWSKCRLGGAKTTTMKWLVIVIDHVIYTCVLAAVFFFFSFLLLYRLVLVLRSIATSAVRILVLVCRNSVHCTASTCCDCDVDASVIYLMLQCTVYWYDYTTYGTSAVATSYVFEWLPTDVRVVMGCMCTLLHGQPNTVLSANPAINCVNITFGGD